ncbi:MAG: hypothetical protein KKB59_19950 [Spirochaetes bacterium]|nr:hypothetical protein [Spirochaetota bacterium]
MAGLMMKYFVLKPEGDDEYAIASRNAILEYAKSIKSTNSDLARDLIDWAHDEDMKSLDRWNNKSCPTCNGKKFIGEASWLSPCPDCSWTKGVDY